jgi:hypothetical protein
MKKYVYIALFTFLGLLLATLLHALIEIPALKLITENYEQYGDGYIWQHWRIIHDVVGACLWLGGALGGYYAGKKWWQILYIEKRYGTPRF